MKPRGYHSFMRQLLAGLCAATACSASFAATGSSVTKAYTDSKGWVHIITADGRGQTIRPQKWQAGGGFEDVAIAPDGRTVGWLADQMLTPFQGGTNYSYPVALDLDVWREGRVIRTIPAPAYSIRDWVFSKDGKEVALHVAPPHGEESYDCSLFDINSGKEIAHWALDRRDYVIPEWAQPLLGSLPDTEDLARRFPDQK